jgi:hypothetical protein
MDNLIKYSGLILEIIGVLFLLIPKLLGATSNGTLIAGGACLVVGILSHIIINKRLL